MPRLPHRKSNADQSLQAQRVYLLSALIGIAAAAVTFWKGRAAYRHLLNYQQAGSTTDLVIMLVAILAIQIVFWTVLIHRPPFKIRKNLVIFTVMLFLSRISFMLAGALFSIVIFVRFEELQLRPVGYVHFIAVLFTIFCISRWLETFGRAFEAGTIRAVR